MFDITEPLAAARAALDPPAHRPADLAYWWRVMPGYADALDVRSDQREEAVELVARIGTVRGG